MSWHEKKDTADPLFEDIREYLSVRSKIFSLQLAETAARILSNLISNAVAILFFTIFFIFASVGLSFLVAAWVGSTAGGFFIVAGFYLVLGLIIWVVKVDFIEIGS